MPIPRSAEALVRFQLSRWEAPAEAERSDAVCIAVARLPYAEGGTLARMLAEELRWGLFGREMIDEIARERGVQKELVAGLDEHVRTTIARFANSGFADKGFTESDYLRGVVQVLATLAQRGMAVVLGRGAPLVLPPERALRVMVVAPREVRLERLARDRGLSAQEAERELADRDQERDHFHHHHFGVDYKDPELYDLVVNSGTLSREARVAIVLDALRARFPKVRGLRKASA